MSCLLVDSKPVQCAHIQCGLPGALEEAQEEIVQCARSLVPREEYFIG